MITQSHATSVEEMTAEEHRAFVEAECQRLLGLSAAEFTERWNRGDYSASDDPKVTRVAMLLPDAR
jgi:hypothetical protein